MDSDARDGQSVSLGLYSGRGPRSLTSTCSYSFTWSELNCLPHSKLGRGNLGLGAVGLDDHLLGLDAPGRLVLAPVAILAEPHVGALELLALLADFVGHRFL